MTMRQIRDKNISTARDYTTDKRTISSTYFTWMSTWFLYNPKRYKLMVSGPHSLILMPRQCKVSVLIIAQLV